MTKCGFSRDDRGEFTQVVRWLKEKSEVNTRYSAAVKLRSRCEFPLQRARGRASFRRSEDGEGIEFVQADTITQ
jgi:hypothetical protein